MYSLFIMREFSVFNSNILVVCYDQALGISWKTKQGSFPHVGTDSYQVYNNYCSG